MRYFLSVFIILFLLLGCAIPAARSSQRQALEEYVAINLPKTKSGEMLRSVYYHGIYDIMATSNFYDKGIQMQALANFIDKAQQLESGKITKEEFELFRLKEVASMQTKIDDLQAQDRQSAARSIPLAPYIQEFKPITIPPTSIRSTVNCITNKVGNSVYTNCN